jgi:hypothetical protein
LVSLKSTIAGGVRYERVDIVTNEALPDGATASEWKTRRVIEDKDEHEQATKTRSNARALITKVCSSTSFGLLCPDEQEGALDAAVKAARQLVDNYNDTAKHTRVGIFVIKGKVASTDAEAARAITQEIAELTVAMDAGIKSFDPKAVRAAADRARELASMLSEEKQGKINSAIEQARKAARMIVKRIEKEGEDRSVVLMDIQRGQIESARIAFLDMSGETSTANESDAMPVVEKQRFADLDMQDDEPLGGGKVKEVLVLKKNITPTIDMEETANAV